MKSVAANFEFSQEQKQFRTEVEPNLLDTGISDSDFLRNVIAGDES